MRFVIMPCLLAALFTVEAAGQTPSVTALTNNYSFAISGTPNYGIAQGSIFDIFGTNLGPAQTPALPDLSQGPLVTTLSGVTISVTVGGTTVKAIPYYVSATQIAAVLPSSTPAGAGTLTVTFNGQAGAPFPIQVVAAVFGIDTLNGSGSGTAVAQDSNSGYSILTPGNAAHPGDVLVLWGSGVGPAAGDETKYPFPQTDLTAASSVKVYIGGKQAQVAYAGRSQFPGVDQINVTVPAGVTGCNVSLVVQTGSMISNTASLPIAASGSTCSDQITTGLSSSDVQSLLSGPTLRTGVITLSKTKTQTPAYTFNGVNYPSTTITGDLAIAAFSKFTTSQVATALAGPVFQQSSVGSCGTYQFVGSPNSLPSSVTPSFLDAGVITVTLPDGTRKSLLKDQLGSYSLAGTDVQGAPTPLFIPAAGGDFTFINTGGTGVGVFSGAKVTMAPALTWTNMDALNTIMKSQGVTVTWDTSAAFTGFLNITGSSFQLNGASTTGIITGFSCSAPYSAGTFTVPGYVLQSMVASQTSVNGVAYPSGLLTLSLMSTPVRFTAPNIDYAVLQAFSSASKSVTFQ